MREFRLSFDETVNMPVRRFWWMRDMVGRLRADDILKLSNLGMLALGSGESRTELFESLIETAGSDYEVEEIHSADPIIDPRTGLDVNFDRQGLSELKALTSAFD